MKTLSVFFMAILFCLSGMAKDSGNSWVVTNNGKIDCKKVNFGYNKARIVLENGEKTAINYNTISALSMNGKTFAKLPLYENGKPTNKMAFMELVKTQGDLSLYKLRFLEREAADPNALSFRYYLYNGKQMHLELNEKSLANICLHFGIPQDEL
jgi:hypothetical protein